MTTMTTTRPPGSLSLGYGESAMIPVPEGRLVLRNVQEQNGPTRQLVVLEPHGGGEPHELAIFGSTMDPAQMLTVALAALDAWR